MPEHFVETTTIFSSPEREEVYKQLWWEDGVMHVHGKVMKVLCEKPEYSISVLYKKSEIYGVYTKSLVGSSLSFFCSLSQKRKLEEQRKKEGSN